MKVGDKIDFFKQDDGFVCFFLKIEEMDPCYVTVSVYEVGDSFLDGTYDEAEAEFYLRVTIKWDGCSHLYFTEEGDCCGSYHHFCGRRFWEQHAKMMLLLYDTVTSLIENYDKRIGG